MNRKTFLQLTVALMAGLGSLKGADAVYQNDGTVSSLDFPQIDAITFINNGWFVATAPLDFAYETQSTVNYTNRGVMQASPGFRFTTVDAAGRRPAAVVNNQGEIEGIDTPLSGFIVVGANGVIAGSSFFTQPASRLILDATNIVNRGLLSAGEGGIIKLTGKNLDLSRGGMRTGVSPGGLEQDLSGVFNTNYHLNSRGIFDYYWASGTNQVLGDPAFGRPIELLFPGSGFDLLPTSTPSEPFSPIHEVLLSGFDPATSFSGIAQIPVLAASLTNRFSAFVMTNYFAATSNAVNQVVYINTNVSSGIIKADVHWLGTVPIVKMSFTEYDPVLEANIESTLFMADTLLFETNHFYTTNLVTSTGRPNNYFVWRADDGLFDFATPSTTPFQFLQHIWSPFWNLTVVSNIYTAYSFTVNQDPGNQSFFIPDNVFGNVVQSFLGIDYGFGAGFGALTDATNLQGRVEMTSEGTFDARFGRIRSENYLSVSAKHFSYNSNTVFNAPIMSLNLGSTNGTLGITNLIPATVGRFNGQISFYSALWTNFVVNFNPDDPDATNATPITTHVFMIDNTQIAADTRVEVQIASLKAADNIFLNNNLNVSKGLVMDAANVTINSNLVVRGLTDRIQGTNFPSLVNLTNNGSILIGDTATFGSPTAPIATFVNKGVFGAYSADIYAGYFKGGGSFLTGGGVGGAGGPTRITADTIDLELATFFNGGDMTLTGQHLLGAFSSLRIGDINVSTLGQESISIGSLTVDIAGSVDDGGVGANNNWRVTDGFHLRRIPAAGDFMGTRLTSRAGRFREIHHTWAGRDFGATEEGFDNNAALGRLVLSGTRFPFFVFDTIDGNNALYVDYLQLDAAATNVLRALEIKPGMKIYFANANLPINQLNGLFADEQAPQGRLRHVSRSTAGSTTVTVNDGRAGGITQALIASQTVDSDGDGIPNALDATPFDGVAIDVELLSGNHPATAISWSAASRTEYQVQYKSAVDGADWESLTNVITGNAAGRLTVQDPVGAAEKRFYRVQYSP